MKFTIVTSFYNGSKFIKNLYEKIKGQTYTNWEWIVTDDFSSDNGKELLLEISNGDRKVKYVEQNHKKEMFYNPQRFCRSSEIIIQVDQDDYPLPKALEVYHHFFIKFTDTIFITCCGNLFKENGEWMNFHNPSYIDKMNMTCGYLTYLRAWRNNPNIEYDFNPNNWMKYYYNDLSIICTLEEQGKVLNLPRNLYYYNYREDSISHSVYGNESVYEGMELIKRINERRLDKDMDTLNRYFESIHLESLCLMDHHLNNSAEQLKISYIDYSIENKKKFLLKELFFDYDFNINKIDGDEDYVVFVIKNMQDLEKFLSTNNLMEIKKIQVVIWNQCENPHTQNIINKLSSIYVIYYQSSYHCLINIIK
jgi:glycosyltransferase involved in cell wall biosynthesis